MDRGAYRLAAPGAISCLVIAKFHYTGPTGQSPRTLSETRSDPADYGRMASPGVMTSLSVTSLASG